MSHEQFSGVHHMKRLLLASAAFAALTTASFAADLSAPIEEVDVWSGYYVGIQGGFAFGQLSVEDITGVFVPAGDELFSSDIEGPFGGAYWGKNWQFDNFVVGLDGSVSFANLEDQNDLITNPDNPDVTIEAFSASRLRLGYAFDNFMIFAAGGFSLAKANVDDGFADDDAWLKGFTVGAGIEAKFAENWSARVEYMFIHYATEQRTLFDAAVPTPYDISVEDVHAVRGGIAYHF